MSHSGVSNPLATKSSATSSPVHDDGLPFELNLRLLRCTSLASDDRDNPANCAFAVVGGLAPTTA